MKITNYVTRLASMTDEEYARCCNMARAVFLSKDRTLNIDYLMESMFDIYSPDTLKSEYGAVLEELLEVRRCSNAHMFVRVHSQLFLQNVAETDSFLHVYENISYLSQVSLNVILFGRPKEFARLYSTDYRFHIVVKAKQLETYRILPRVIKPEYLVNNVSVSMEDLISDYRLLLKEIVQFAELTGGEITYD